MRRPIRRHPPRFTERNLYGQGATQSKSTRHPPLPRPAMITPRGMGNGSRFILTFEGRTINQCFAPNEFHILVDSESCCPVGCALWFDNRHKGDAPPSSDHKRECKALCSACNSSKINRKPACKVATRSVNYCTFQLPHSKIISNHLDLTYSNNEYVSGSGLAGPSPR